MPTYSPPSSHVLSLVGATLLPGVCLAALGWPWESASALTGLLVAVTLTALPALQPASRDWPALRLSFVLEFVSLLTFGAVPTMGVAAYGLLARHVFNRQHFRARWQFVLPVMTLACAWQAAAYAFASLGGTPAELSWPQAAVPVAAAVFAYCLVIAAFTIVLVPLVASRSIRVAWPVCGVHTLRGCATYLVGASVAAGLVEMIVQRRWDALAVTAIPLVLAYWVYVDHVNRLEDECRRSAEMQSAAEAARQGATAERRTMQALRRQSERLELAVQAASDGFWELDLGAQQLYVTGPWNAMIGRPHEPCVSAPEYWLERVHAEDIGPLKGALEAHLSGKVDHFEHEYRMRHEDGSYRLIRCRGVATRNANGRATRIAGAVTDVTDLYSAQAQLRNAVYLDPLTGLCNRALFVEQLGRRLKAARERSTGGAFALLYLDLDRFKVINDSLGHLVGDELLVAVSRRLETCLRQGDVLSRLGGDEFAILLNGLQTEQQANVIAFRVQETLSKPFSIAGREVFTSASIGIAYGAPQYTTPDEMMHDADTAMYQAKAHGKARHEIFDADMDARARDRLGLENDLRRAVSNGEIEVHYQPIVALGTGMCVGFESLVRWSRNGKPVSPSIFVPIAEELGLIEGLGTRVLEEVCRTFAAWQRAMPVAGLECVTVNVSSRQLMQPNFLSVVDRAIRLAGLDRGALRLEITETALMTDPQEAARVLKQLRDFGVKIYLDDFGTGYSSLSHLHKMPVDALKIDRSFVESLFLPHRPAIVESIMALARTLHTSVVAEGIETEAQARELERLGCTRAQGYLFSRAVPTAAAEAIVRNGFPLGPQRVEASAVPLNLRQRQQEGQEVRSVSF